jgi:Ca2+-dependent lipid-binding protein
MIEGVELTRRKSAVVKGTLNPVWERQHFADFDATHAANFANILFEVWDYDAGLRDDYMGQCSLNINEILKQQARVWSSHLITFVHVMFIGSLPISYHVI